MFSTVSARNSVCTTWTSQAQRKHEQRKHRQKFMQTLPKRIPSTGISIQNQYSQHNKVITARVVRHSSLARV